MKKENPLDVATKTINDVFSIMSGRTLHGDLLDAFNLLADCRLKLDRMWASKAKRKDMTMKQREDEKTRRLRGQLAIAERDYITLAKRNPQSTNDTQAHLASLEKLVRDMMHEALVRALLLALIVTGIYAGSITVIPDICTLPTLLRTRSRFARWIGAFQTA